MVHAMQAPSSLTSLDIAPRTLQEHPEWSELYQRPPSIANLLQGISSLRSLSCTVRAPLPQSCVCFKRSLHVWRHHWGVCTIVKRVHTCTGTCEIPVSCLSLPKSVQKHRMDSTRAIFLLVVVGGQSWRPAAATGWPGQAVAAHRGPSSELPGIWDPLQVQGIRGCICMHACIMHALHMQCADCRAHVSFGNRSLVKSLRACRVWLT